jgi:hypothetical protein
VKKLFSRKPKGSGGEKQKKVESAGGLSLARLNLIPLVAAVLLLLASGYAAYLQFASQVAMRHQETEAAVARELAARLSGRLQALDDELLRLAQADATLLAAIAAGEQTVLRQRERALAATFPEAMRIRYILPSEQDPDNTVTPSLSYACLDLARRAEAGQTPPFEVHLFGDEQQHLDLVRPVSDGGKPVASLMVTLDVEVLRHWLAALRPAQGYTELQQGIGSGALVLFGLGERALKGQVEAQRVPVAMSGWQLSYYPPDTIGMAEAHQFGFLATFAVAAVLLVLFFLFYNLFLSRLLRSDLKRLVGFIVDSSLGKRFHSYPVKLAESKRVLQEKEVDLSVLSSHASIKEKPAGAHGGAAQAEHIPDLTFASDEGMTVEEVEGNKGEADATPGGSQDKG